MLRSLLLRYWLSDFLASFGSGLRLAAFPLLAAGITSSPTAIAAVVAVQGLPWLLIGPWVGVYVDRHDLRRAMVVVQVVQVVVIGALAAAVITHVYDLPILYGAALITGVASTVRTTATQSAILRLVARDDLDRTNGRLVAGELIGSELIGPASAGWLFGVAAALPFAVNAGGIGVAVLLLLTLPSVFRPLPRPSQPQRAVRSALGELREGLGWLARDRVVRGLVATVGVVAITDASWFAVLVLYVTRVLRQSAGDYGLLLAFGALGGIAASAACGRLARRIGGHRLLVVTVVTMAATQLVLGLTANVVVAAGMLAASSGSFAVFNVTAVGMRQRRVPARLLGRVNSAYLAVGGGAEALGALLGGTLASSAGIRAPMLVGVIPLLGIAAVLLIRPRSEPIPPG